MSFDELYKNWKKDNNALSVEELNYLYNTAKNAYYNGDELISDIEFDKIEKQLGQENKGYVGSKTGNYTEKHSFIMGSLSKVQIKENKKNGEVNWDESAEKISSFLNKSNGTTIYETTPKLDGCSFSAEFKNIGGEAILVSCATRGDGQFGTDISHWFKPIVKSNYWNKIDDAVTHLCKENSNDIFCVRGEVLIPHASFNEKFQADFTNPRSFVAGCLNAKWENTKTQKEYSSNLHFVCYDYRIVNGSDNSFIELDWMCPSDSTYSLLKPYLGHIGELPDEEYCQIHKYKGKLSSNDLKKIYADYDDFRNNYTKYALDGIVFKPTASTRQYNDKRARPVDCVAMKFMPMMNVTTIVDIKWTIGKTGECTPIAIIDTIKLDGKNINKASLHNYNYIMTHDAGIGAKVRISLAGDIIPFVYEIVEPGDINNINKPNDTYIETDPTSGNMHLMKKFTTDEKAKNQFLASAKALNINNIGPAAAGNLWDVLYDILPEECPEIGDTLNNVIQILPKNTHKFIKERLGMGKSIQNIIDSLDDFALKIELSDVIKSFCFKNCGERASILCAKLLSGQKASTASFPADAYNWVNNPSSEQYQLVQNAIDYLHINISKNTSNNTNSSAIPVILTGSPKECGYNTKKDFLTEHPEYTETTIWSECKILFTDDLNSTSSKMKKAEKNGIKIMTYDQA